MFYMPRSYANMQMPQTQQRQTANNPLMQRGTVSTSSALQQPSNPLSTISDATTMYKMGSGAGKLYGDVSGAGSVSPQTNALLNTPVSEASMAGDVQGANPLFSGISNESPSWLSTVGDKAASLFAGSPSAPTNALLSTPLSEASMAGDVAASNPLFAGAAGIGENATAAAMGNAAADTAGTLGLESAGLGALGPVGILAGAGLLGSKLFGLW